MNLLFADSKTISLQEQKRSILAPVLVVAALSLPLCTSSSSFITTSWVSLSSGITFSLLSVLPPTGADGFALFAEAHKGTWQIPETGGCAASEVPHQGGLVGAFVDPAFGPADEVGMVADFGYDTARDMVRYGSLATAIFASCFFVMRLRASKRKRELTKMQIFVAVLSVLLLTATVHLVGTFIINSFGGLGSHC